MREHVHHVLLEALGLLLAEHALDGAAEQVEVKGLGDIVGDALVEGLDDGLSAGVARDDDDGGLRALLGHVAHDVEAIDLVHSEVGDDEVESFAIDEVESGDAAGRGLHLVADTTEEGGEALREAVLVVDHEDALLGKARGDGGGHHGGGLAGQGGVRESEPPQPEFAVAGTQSEIGSS